MGFLDKIKTAFKKTSEKFSISCRKIDENSIQEIEEMLILADISAETAAKLVKKISDRKFPKETTSIDVKKVLAEEICAILTPYENDFFERKLLHHPEIVLVIGVNGNGKTTTIAKIAHIFKESGHDPLLVAGDTFRAAATEQLEYWASKIGVDIMTTSEGADAAGLVYDSVKKAISEEKDVVLIDTAGRMQNRGDLLDELEKIKRVIKKIDETAPHITILVLDGLTGQAVHNQVEVFMNKIGIDGIIVTKLDGTAKGGAIISLVEKYKLPIFALGLGEGINDLKPFNARMYASAILDVDI
ncbi:MAG: signal recognition particle-docking protein FtsY [Holosporaceae bacterium]|jgi:fused signal recognition particle receptor|nr:signal recognition particle-docking protein FtsY [Holosporaceae bacterium]